jgi:hypothetical protein
MTSQTCNRIDLAREQLEMALVAFLERHRFASAITLASAAERVLGQALLNKGQQAGVDWKFDAADLAHTKLHGRPLDRKTFSDAENCVANALRHFDKADAPDFEADLEEAACWMLVPGLRERTPARADRAGLRRVQRLVLRTRRRRLTAAAN